MMMMMAEKNSEKEDLGLSLSLSFPQKEAQPIDHQKLPWMHAFYTPEKAISGDSCRGGGDSSIFLRGIDVNRSITCDDDEQDLAGVSSPNSTVSSISGKRPAADRDPTGSTVSEDEDYGDNSRKKLRLSKDQSAVLEESFKEHSTLNPKQKLSLAKQLGLRPRQVEVWFQNRRARTKLKQTEIDCEFLKRCCENLTEENRRLQKEVQELRSLKLSPQFFMQMAAPPTTLTMCPSCERVGPPPSGLDSKHNQRPMVFNPWSQSVVPGGRNALRPRS